MHPPEYCRPTRSLIVALVKSKNKTLCIVISSYIKLWDTHIGKNNFRVKHLKTKTRTLCGVGLHSALEEVVFLGSLKLPQWSFNEDIFLTVFPDSLKLSSQAEEA